MNQRAPRFESKALRDSARGRIGGNKQKLLFGETEPVQMLGRTAKRCACGEWFSVPSCHASRHQSCSRKCGLDRLRAPKRARLRACIECGKQFTPRSGQVRDGIGKFCSKGCGLKAWHRTDAAKEVSKKVAVRLQAMYASGELKNLSGPDNPSWKGGPEAAKKRLRESGKLAARVREYRAKHPLKMREWSRKRRTGDRFPRLPHGTTQRILELQRNRCASCHAALTPGFHLDHIVPLAKGGAHEPHNLQALCPTCNVRKWAYDPIVWAQKEGRLL